MGAELVSTSMIRGWLVDYDHKDGRSGRVKVITETSRSGNFDYGNNTSGSLTVGDYMELYDLRYSSNRPHSKQMHMEMIRDYFEKGFVRAVEVGAE